MIYLRNRYCQLLLQKKGYSIISNDIQYYSFVLNKQYIENHKHLEFKKLIKILPELKNIEMGERKTLLAIISQILKE